MPIHVAPGSNVSSGFQSNVTQGIIGANENKVNILPTQQYPQHRLPTSPSQHYSCSTPYTQGGGSLPQNTGSYGQNHPFMVFQQRGVNFQISSNLQNFPNSLGNSVVSSGSAIQSDVGLITRNSLVGFHKLLEMGNEPERRPWLEHYVSFMNELGKPLVGLPQVVKQPLDLYRFYLAVRERGGVIEVIKNRKWKEVSQVVNINASASAAYTLRKNYCKYLLDYECRFDRGGTDPRPIIAHIEALSGKKKKHTKMGDSDSLQPPAPPSPCGSHSSASSSLLPPGSSGASLSGGPSGTAGSAASDSQLGPPSGLQQRFSDQAQPGSVSTVLESPNGNTNVPSPVTSVSSNNLFTSSVSTSSSTSSHFPLSSSIVNGFPGSMTDSSNSWPWSTEIGTKEINRTSQMLDLPNSKPNSPTKEHSVSLRRFLNVVF